MTAGGGDVPTGLTSFQAEVARAFSSLAEAADFRLAGGSAMAALRLSDRMSRDLDLFRADGTVDDALQAFVIEAERRGWSMTVLRRAPTFCQLEVGNASEERVLVDLAVNGATLLGPVPTAVGQAFAPEELAAQKVLALFGRAAARDFVDVFVLARRFGTELLLRRAHELDAGFDEAVLVEMIAMLDRYRDEDLPTDEPDALRRFFARWADDLEA